MFINPIVAMIHNTTAATWHPVLFVEDPLPGPDTPEKPVRHKSEMHHTTGFATQDEAESDARNNLAQKVEGCRLELSTVFEWDGKDIPAMTHFFGSGS